MPKILTPESTLPLTHAPRRSTVKGKFRVSEVLFMKRSLAAACIVFSLSGAPLKIVLVGDSTVNDEGGWGPGFRASFGVEVEVMNLARNGRSSKSFRAEGFWEPALAAKPAYILIQFGHNDVPGKGPDRETGA